MDGVLAILFAGGVGECMKPLTREQSKPAFPFTLLEERPVAAMRIAAA